MKKMKALVKAKAEKGIWMEEVPIPEPGLNDVIIKIKKTAICGTDLHIYLWDQWAQKTIKVPMVIGHEYMGYIEKTGRVKNLARDRVTVKASGMRIAGTAGGKGACAETQWYRVNIDGAFAEYLRLPALNAVPDKGYPMRAAIMDPFGMHTRLSLPSSGGRRSCNGAGLIGSMAIAIAKYSGARFSASDLSDYRPEIANRWEPL